MIKSLYSGVTGLKTHNQRMDVIGNNIANVNTTAYKAGTVTFKDVYYQTKQNASGGSYTSGGMNPKQVGYGVQLGTISKVMTQSGLTYSDSVFDCALEGSGFFQVMDSAGNIYYTRLGRFSLDDVGNLCDPSGNIVLGISGDPTNVQAGSQRINVAIPAIENSNATATKAYLGHNIVFTAGGYGPGGNIAITVINSDVPFATMSGSTLNVYMDLNKDYETIASTNLGGRPTVGTALTAAQAAAIGVTGTPAATAQHVALWDNALVVEISSLLSNDIRDAIRVGGVNVDPAILSMDAAGNIVSGISVSFESVPDETAAQRAENYVEIRNSAALTTDTAASNIIRLGFRAQIPGAFANRYEIDVQTSSSAAVSAKWTDNVLVVTVPQTGTFTAGEVYAAIETAAGGDSRKMFDVMTQIPTGTVGTPVWGTAPAYQTTGTGGQAFGAYSAAIGALTREDGSRITLRTGLAGGTDSFFTEAFSSLTTVRLDGGYLFTEQDASTCEIIIDKNGVIYGRHPVHGELLLGRIDVVDFVNPGGLNQVGTSYFTESLASGPPQVRIPADESETFIISGALEMSNVDLSQEFSDMIITQRGFQANSRIITVSDTMLEELINLKR
ncbi:MAG: flagellar hook-basal body complex protein [Oscillospiraceae bacterium]|jgi:flagellar hook protein FlgE|nr:flagellar hook-basal body complex protein [Oscillospiraceae bacterium]